MQTTNLVLEDFSQFVDFITNQKISRNTCMDYKCAICGKIVKQANMYYSKRAYLAGCFADQTLRCRLCKTHLSKKARYGDENYNNRQKAKQTCLQTYGVDNISKLPESRQKAIQTNLDRFGKDNFSNREKYKETCIARYGVESTNKLQSVKEKKKQTNYEKYGNWYTCIPGNIKRWKDFSEEKKLAIRTRSSLTHLNFSLTKKLDIAQKRSKKYLYDSEMFDSSWELALWIYAKDHNEEIEREPCCFTFLIKDKQLTYVPDFKYKGELVEIKGDQFFDESGKMICPFNRSLDEVYEAKHLCGLTNGVKFLKKDDLLHVFAYIKETYGADFLQSFRRK